MRGTRRKCNAEQDVGFCLSARPGGSASLIVASRRGCRWCRSRRCRWRRCRCRRCRCRWRGCRGPQRRECDGRNGCCKCQYTGGEDGPRRGEAFFAQCRRPRGNKQQVSRIWPGGAPHALLPRQVSPARRRDGRAADGQGLFGRAHRARRLSGSGLRPLGQIRPGGAGRGGQGDVPLIELRLRCSACGKTGTRSKSAAAATNWCRPSRGSACLLQHASPCSPPCSSSPRTLPPRSAPPMSKRASCRPPSSCVAVPRDHRQRRGAGVRPDHRRLETAARGGLSDYPVTPS